MTLRSKIAAIFLGGIILILLVFQTPLLQPVRLKVWGWWVQSVARIGKIGTLSVENDTLSQLRSLQLENVRLKSELESYKLLQQQLGTVPFSDLRTIPALVAAQPADAFRTQFILNRGAQEGVVLNAPVVTQGSMLVGFISELSEHSSVCQLLINPAIAIPAEVTGEEGSRGLLKGQTYTSVVLTTVPRDIPLKENQQVVTTAQGDTPPGLLIGSIATVTNEKNEAYQKATIQLPYNIDDLRAITVLVAP